MPVRTIYKYPLDLLGTSPTNKKVNEVHTIGSRRGRSFVADDGPFFGNSVVIRDQMSGRTLTPGLDKDYILIHTYREAQEATGQAVYSGVRITNPDVSTSIEMDLQYVGGEFSYSTHTIFELLEQVELDNRPMEWGDLVGIPNEFTPAPHLHSAYDLYSMREVVVATMDIAKAIREGWIPATEAVFKMVSDRLELHETIIPKLTASYKDATKRINDLILYG